MAMPVSADRSLRARKVPSRRPAVPAVWWWARDFPGSPGQVGEARRWTSDLLPGCDPLDDLVLLASELCANAVVHTRSGRPGGRFSVAVEWAPGLARVVIGDQGSPSSPVAGARTGGTAGDGESGRGLRIVDELADDWGTASHPGHRWVWADLRWRARGGPPLDPPGGTGAVIAGITAIRHAFPGTTTWWGHLAQSWRAALPGASDVSGLLSSPSLVGLSHALADAYPRSRCGERWTGLASVRLETLQGKAMT